MKIARLAGLVAPPIFIGVWILAGLLDPHYSFLTGHGSDLATGSMGWLMTANFILTGLLLVAFGSFLVRSGSRVLGSLALVVGVTLVLSGVFAEDGSGAVATTHGQVHNLAFVLLFLAIFIAALYSGIRGRGGWRVHALLTALTIPVALAAFILVASDPSDPLYPVGGLLQLGLVVVAFAWLMMLAVWQGRSAETLTAP